MILSRKQAWEQAKDIRTGKDHHRHYWQKMTKVGIRPMPTVLLRNLCDHSDDEIFTPGSLWLLKPKGKEMNPPVVMLQKKLGDSLWRACQIFFEPAMATRKDLIVPPEYQANLAGIETVVESWNNYFVNTKDLISLVGSFSKNVVEAVSHMQRTDFSFPPHWPITTMPLRANDPRRSFMQLEQKVGEEYQLSPWLLPWQIAKQHIMKSFKLISEIEETASTTLKEVLPYLMPPPGGSMVPEGASDDNTIPVIHINICAEDIQTSVVLASLDMAYNKSAEKVELGVDLPADFTSQSVKTVFSCSWLDKNGQIVAGSLSQKERIIKTDGGYISFAAKGISQELYRDGKPKISVLTTPAIGGENEN